MSVAEGKTHGIDAPRQLPNPEEVELGLALSPAFSDEDYFE